MGRSIVEASIILRSIHRGNPCQAINEHLTQITGENLERVKAVGVDIESNPTVTANYNVLKIPTLILFKNGQEVTRLEGNQTKRSILEAISPHFDQ